MLARGVRKEKAKFQVSFDVFDSGEFTTKAGKGSLEVLVHFKPHKSLSLLRADLDRFVLSSNLVEAFDNLTHEGSGEESVELYETLGLGLRSVEEAADVKEMLRGVYLTLATLLQICGFAYDTDSRPPSVKNLLVLLDSIEHHSERELKSKPSTIEVLLEFQKKNSMPAKVSM